MDKVTIGQFLDRRIPEFRGAEWRPHYLLPTNYQKLLISDMEKLFGEISALDIVGLTNQGGLRARKTDLKVALDKAKRARYFDHVEFLGHMSGFYTEAKGFLETLWKLRLKKEI